MGVRFAGSVLSCLLVASATALAGPGVASSAMVQLAFGQCGCLCVEGVPRTLCTSVEEAQAEPGLCGQRHCPDYVATEAGGRRYVSPSAFADNCRDVRVWDSSLGRYAGVKVCDVLELTSSP